MKINYADKFREDLSEFREATKKFYNKELTVNEYKGISGAFGSYAQRGAQQSMLRLRLCGGRMTKDYFHFLLESVEKHNIDLVHLTTCQSIQLHNLSCDVVCSLVEEAWDHGFITRGGGGDFPRNVMVSPLTGVEKDEYFNLTPYAEIASDYLLGFIKEVKLPRKLKVCFSSSPKNWPHATFRDLGFVAKENGKFDVYCAGGLGPNPKLGVCVAKDVEPTKILYYIRAMVDTFTSYGNYQQRAKARTRYMQDTLGQEGLKEAFEEKLRDVMAREELDIEVPSFEFKKQGTSEKLVDRRVLQQKQPGLYAVSYHPIGGNLAPKKIREIYEAISQMNEVEIRLTPNEGLFFINCTAEEAKKLMAITDDGARTEFETSVACIGASICQVGLRDSQDLLKACVDAVRPYDFADGVLPRIRISGCPSSCSAHQVGAISFRGAGKKTEEGLMPAFAVFAGGCDLQGEEQFASDIGVMFTTDIPKFLIELGQTIRDAGSTYEKWINGHQDEFRAIAAKYV